MSIAILELSESLFRLYEVKSEISLTLSSFSDKFELLIDSEHNDSIDDYEAIILLDISRCLFVLDTY